MTDFDGDGKPDGVTPHTGVELTPHRYRAPHVPYAKAMDTSNHLMGSPEQQSAVILQLPSQRPTIIVPDMSLKPCTPGAGNASAGRPSLKSRPM